MARTELTNHELNALQRDVESLSQTSPAFRIFLKEKIKRFYQQNAVQLQRLNNFLRKNVKEHVQHDENDQPMTEERDGVKHYKFATLEDEEAYIADATTFMNRTIYIEL
jgi:hypothetical protein